MPTFLIDLLALLKQRVGILPGDTTEDARLLHSINLSLATIERYIDDIIMQREITEDYAHHFGVVPLAHAPAHGAVVVTIDGKVDTDYKVYSERGVDYLTISTTAEYIPLDWSAFAKVTVVYTAGFDPVPPDLLEALILVALDDYHSGADHQVISSVSIPDVGTLRFDTKSTTASGPGVTGLFPSAVYALLAPYRRWNC